MPTSDSGRNGLSNGQIVFDGLGGRQNQLGELKATLN